MKKTLLLMLILLLAAGCNGPDSQSPQDFLAAHGIPVEEPPQGFGVTIPASWAVPLGAYPEGLYWGMAAELSRDVGLDITPFKGKHVLIDRFAIKGGLPGAGEQSKFSYPSDAVVLIYEGKIVGAWLAFNKGGIGPSVNQRSLEQITGLAYEQWVEQQGYFKDAGPNADLAKLGPGEVLAAFLDAATRGDQQRANACLTPAALRDALTTNLEPWHRLYNPGFGRTNSLAANIVKGKLLGYRMLDLDGTAESITEVGDRTRVELVAEVELTWRDEVFNTPDGKATRFAIMQKGPNGWKLGGLGTGP